MLAAGLAWVDGVTGAKLPKRLFWPLSRMLVFVCIGLVVAQAIDDTRITSYNVCYTKLLRDQKPDKKRQAVILFFSDFRHNARFSWI